MRLFINELRKILHMRVLLIAFIAILVLNGGLVYWQSQKTAATYVFLRDTYVVFYDYYINNSKEIDDYYKELTIYKTEQAMAKRKAEVSGGEFFETRQAIYTDGLYTNDIIIIEKLYADYKWANSFVKETGIFIKNTETNFRDYIYRGYAEDSYLCKFQLRVQKLYTNARDNVKLIFEPVRGWEDFYSFKITGFLLLSMTTLVASVAFIREKDVGTLPIIRVSKRGRVNTSIAKILAVCLFVSVCSVLLTLETYVIFGFTEGYSSGSNAIQILPDLRRSWLILSLREYFWVHLFLRTLGAVAFAILVMTISVFLYNYVLTYMASLALFGLNLWMYSAGGANKQGIISHFNAVSLAEGVRPAERYFGVNLFSAVCGRLTFIVIASAVFCILCAVGAAFLYCRGFSGYGLKRISPVLDKLVALIPKRKKKPRVPRPRVFSLSLALTEGYKLLFATRVWIIVLALFIVRGYAIGRSPEITNAHGYSDALYETYVTQVEGEWSEEKEGRLEQLFIEQSEIISAHDDMKQKKKNNEISISEYLEYTKKYNQAPAKFNVLSGLLSHSGYLRGNENSNMPRG